MAHITNLLKQMLKEIFGEGSLNWLMTFVQTRAIIQPEKGMGGQGQEPWCDTTFVQLTISTLALKTVHAFINESHKIKFFENIDHDKIAALEARVRVIKGVDLYDHVQAAEMCLVLYVVVPKKIHIPKFIKYNRT